ncbi:phage tail protein [Chromobacterium haemolyticum]|uniref:phage tail protein n=1 Tax=Chromobacterium haemolyticum TaxID=394935 RepID=UPI0017475891|nr:phage tail protein [Chromobacterium haemolyticum]QOD82868.1 phage tail protein [Chromobacterium haemolyticum]
MYAVLGNIEFDLISYFDGLEQRSGSDFAEHGRIGGKPVLQFVGDKLDEIRIDLVLHAAYCQPDEELQKLQAARQQHQALAFVLGNGDYKGRFVISELQSTGRQTDRSGSLLAVEAQLSLREYGGDAPPKPKPALAKAAASLPAGKLKLPAGLERFKADIAGLAKTVAQVKSVVGKVKTVINTARELRQLASRDPAAALEKLPGLLKEVQAAAPGLQVSAEQMAKFEQYSKLAGDAVRVGQSLQQAKLNMTAMGRLLTGTPAGQVLDKLAACEEINGRSEVALRELAEPLAGLAAKAAVRRILR